MAEAKEIKLKNGGLIHYRLPNVLEQLEFFSKSGWYNQDEGLRADIYMRTIKAIEACKPFILDIEGPEKTFESLLDDRDNMDAFSTLAWDLAGMKLGEEEKKR